MSLHKRNQTYRPTSGYISRFVQNLPIVSDGSPILNGYELNTYKEIADDMVFSLSLYGRAINSLSDFHNPTLKNDLIQKINDWWIQDDYHLGIQKCMNEVDKHFSDR